MTICEKIIEKSPKEIHLYKEGAFWIAYEQSAYYIFLKKGYKPTKKFVKKVNSEVVSVGFPENALASLDPAFNEKQNGEMHIVLQMEEVINEAEFREWKNNLELHIAEERNFSPLHKQNGDNPCYKAAEVQDIVGRIRAFDLSNATPMDCMMFVHALKKECNGFV